MSPGPRDNSILPYLQIVPEEEIYVFKMFIQIYQKCCDDQAKYQRAGCDSWSYKKGRVRVWNSMQRGKSEQGWQVRAAMLMDRASFSKSRGESFWWIRVAGQVSRAQIKKGLVNHLWSMDLNLSRVLSSGIRQLDLPFRKSFLAAIWKRNSNVS